MKIMVVDNDPDIVFVLESILMKYGADVIGVTDSKQCLPMVKKEMPDLIFLDVMMPGTNGWEICKNIKEDSDTSDIFVSMLTIRQEEEDKRRSLEYAKANRHLCKPINLDEIREVVEGVRIQN
jgi:two-component system alkaline phosphatase synthesis response regulator PhoP